MKFSDLKLYCAVHLVKNHVGSKDYILDEERRVVAILVRDAYTGLTGDVRFPYSIDRVNKVLINHRKGKAKLAAATALAHRQFECFWKSRGKGECSDEVTFGHLVAKSLGGKESPDNGIIECKYHNCSRGILSIEDYIQREVEVSCGPA